MGEIKEIAHVDDLGKVNVGEPSAPEDGAIMFYDSDDSDIKLKFFDGTVQKLMDKDDGLGSGFGR